MSAFIINFELLQRKKAGKNMCTVLEKIRNRTPNEILEQYDLDKVAPIDIGYLLQQLKISAIGKDFSELEKAKKVEPGSILGALLSSGNNAAIFFRESDSYNRQRFTIAHELAHAMLHTDAFPHIEYRMNRQEIENNPLEKKANILAGQLLIPFDLLKKEYMQLFVPSSRSLAKIFEVSTNVMEARLDYLKISYYNSQGMAIVYAPRK